MKYSIELNLEAPRSVVIELFDNPDNMKKWQSDLQRFEHISGEPGQVGAKSKLKYKMGKRAIEMVETITVNNLPDEFSGTYETGGVWNEVNNHFSETGPEQTRWRLNTEFQCGGFFMKLMMFFMPGAFKKQSSKFMHNFKEFVETEYAKRNS